MRYNQSLVRGTIHFGIVASLLLSFAQAPVQHAHKSDPRHEHAKGLFHTHWSGASANNPVWDADSHDSDARMIEWYAGDGSAPAKFFIDLPESIAQPVVTLQVTRILELTPHNHDPPRCLNLIPRAPPA